MQEIITSKELYDALTGPARDGQIHRIRLADIRLKDKLIEIDAVRAGHFCKAHMRVLSYENIGVWFSSVDEATVDNAHITLIRKDMVEQNDIYSSPGEVNAFLHNHGLTDDDLCAAVLVSTVEDSAEAAFTKVLDLVKNNDIVKENNTAKYSPIFNKNLFLTFSIDDKSV